MTAYDFAVVGGGVNGLTAAAYLARRGFSVILLEKNRELGGCAITRELTLPGFKHDVMATSLNIFKAGPVKDDLELERYGFREALPDPVTAHPFPDGRALYIYRDIKKSIESVGKFSARDAKRFGEIMEMFRQSSDALLGGMLGPPTPLSAMASFLEGTEEGQEFLRLTFLSARDFMDENFESEEVKAWLSVWVSNHVPFPPEEPGTTIFLLVFLGLLQFRGCGVPIGGMSSLVAAIARYLQEHGGVIMTGSEVARIAVRDGRAVGVVLSGGGQIEVRRGVLSSVEPKTLFLKMVGEEHLDSSFVQKVRRFKFSTVSQVMIHAALDDWIPYTSGDVRRAGIVQIGETVESVSRAYNLCINGQLPDEPFMTVDNTTLYDSSRAPHGKHTLWDFVRTPAKLKHDSWEDVKESFADRCMDVLERYAPGFRRTILKRVVLTPVDLENMNSNIVNADPGVGKASLDQSLSMRPFPGYSNYRTPVKGLYMCGAYTHPGGGVSGIPGRNAALEAIEDVEKKII
ncbi:Diapolycopene oxygenase [archaeon HR01]|nr:Diapolycopene oxygenase [archaeon HR01]